MVPLRPFALVELCREALAEAGSRASACVSELFTAGEARRARADGGARPSAVRADEPVRRIDFTLDGQSASVDSPVDANETILAAALLCGPTCPSRARGASAEPAAHAWSRGRSR